MWRAISFAALTLCCAPMRAQCSPHVEHFNHHNHLATPQGVSIPDDNFIQASYRLGGSDHLMIYAVKIYAGQTDLGSAVRGLILTKQNHQPQLIEFSSLLEKSGQKQESNDPDNYFLLGFAQGCSGGKPIYFASFHYDGDITSPELFLVIRSTGESYTVSTLPPISAGILLISKSDARSLTEWSSLGEGDCNACDTRYEVTNLYLSGVHTKQLHKYKTKERYTSGNHLWNDLAMRFAP